MDDKRGTYTIWGKPMEVHQNLLPLSKMNRSNRVGNGIKTSFWEDKWLGNFSLKSIFPEMHDLAVNKQASVAEVWTQNGWNFQFRRNFNDWEIETVTHLFGRLEAFTGTRDEHDILWWRKKIKKAHSR